MMASTDTVTADDLRVGDRLEDDWDCELVVTDVGNGELTWEEDDGTTETHSLAAVQSSLDHGEVRLVERGEAAADEADDGYGSMEIVDTDPATIPDSELYIRFGNVPEDERSYDNRNDQYEDGVSVYACERRSIEEGAETDADEAYYLKGTMLQTVFALMFRDTYLVTGEQVGTGADGEPVLRNVKAVAELTTPKGTGGWVPK